MVISLRSCNCLSLRATRNSLRTSDQIGAGREFDRLVDGLIRLVSFHFG